MPACLLVRDELVPSWRPVLFTDFVANKALQTELRRDTSQGPVLAPRTPGPPHPVLGPGAGHRWGSVVWVQASLPTWEVQTTTELLSVTHTPNVKGLLPMKVNCLLSVGTYTFHLFTLTIQESKDPYC